MSIGTNPNYLVQILQYGAPGYGAPVISVTAPIPESVNFEASADYQPLLPQSFIKNEAARTASAVMGMKLAVQALTAQLWTGSTTGDLSMNLEFYTENDPIQDVQTPVKNLMKLVTPTISDEGLMKSPGPQLDFTTLGSVAADTLTNSVTTAGTALSTIGGAVKNFAIGAYNQLTGKTPNQGQMADGQSTTTDSTSAFTPQALAKNPQMGTAAYWKNQVSNRIQIRIGNYLFFDNVVVTHVGNAFTSTFDANTGLPHHVIVTLNFRPMFTLSAQDLDNVFVNPGGSGSGTTTGQNTYGFSIPNAVAGAATNVTNQFGINSSFGV